MEVQTCLAISPSVSSFTITQVAIDFIITASMEAGLREALINILSGKKYIHETLSFTCMREGKYNPWNYLFSTM